MGQVFISYMVSMILGYFYIDYIRDEKRLKSLTHASSAQGGVTCATCHKAAEYVDARCNDVDSRSIVGKRSEGVGFVASRDRYGAGSGRRRVIGGVLVVVAGGHDDRDACARHSGDHLVH
jgi:hypothetical protein